MINSKCILWVVGYIQYIRNILLGNIETGLCVSGMSIHFAGDEDREEDDDKY